MMGRLWRLDDNIDTDVLAPGAYMKAPLDELASHCLSAVRPEFAKEVKSGDIIIAGHNMGIGSSREQAAEVLKYFGISAIFSPLFGGIFYRNAINMGLPALQINDSDLNHPDLIDGAEVEFNLPNATLIFKKTGNTLMAEPLPSFLIDLICDGGLVPHLEKKLKNRVIS
jgi:3-isopropylmalate/(R)-2-methylmalate dehydratase small subunit